MWGAHALHALLAVGRGRDWAVCAPWRQVVMAVFSYLYFNSYVAREVSVTIGSVLQVRHTHGCAEVPAGISKTMRVSSHAQAPASARMPGISSRHPCG